MNFKFVSNDKLIEQMTKLVKTERKITYLVLVHINEIEERGLHLDMGYGGMYAYLTQGLGFSDGAAYRRLQSARLLKQVPAVAEKIENGVLNLSQLTQVQTCLRESRQKGINVTPTQTQEVLNKLEHKNGFETQKTLAVEFNLPVQNHQKLTPQKDNSVRLEITLTAEQFAELETARNLLSHICVDGQWADVIATLAAKFNKQKFGGRSLKLLG